MENLPDLVKMPGSTGTTFFWATHPVFTLPNTVLSLLPQLLTEESWLISNFMAHFRYLQWSKEKENRVRKKGSLGKRQKSIFRYSREFRDSRDFREPPDSRK